LKNIDYVIRKTALEMEIPETEVKAIIDWYWGQIYQKMVNGMDDDKATLFLRNIGLFTVSRYKLNNFIIKKLDKIKGMTVSTKYSEEVKKNFIERQKSKLKLSLKYRNLVAIDYAKKFKNI